MSASDKDVGSSEDITEIIDVPAGEQTASGSRQINGGGTGVNVPTAPLHSEEALALMFAERHADTLRFVAKWGQWFIWDGTCWRIDETRHVFSLARELCREVANTINKPKERKQIASAKTRAAVVSLAGEDRRLAATIEQWDADPWLINTPGGVIDLRTGKLREHRSEDFMTRITAVMPDASCPTPLWGSFLDKVTAGDRDLQAFLARICGYGLTGVTDEHAMFFLYGLGKNGKTVFVNTVTGILGDYHRTAAIETFTASNTDRHPTELAMLRGARLVTAIETEEGRRWAESRIKTLTGGDRLAARFMRQDFFEYAPQFKLMVAGNHKPGLRSVDMAIRRRMNLVPFSVTIPEEERDIKLGEKLKAERPGILAWMVAGCLEWQRTGLAQPKAVVDATNSYLDAEDTFSIWFDDCCKLDKREWTSTRDIYEVWTEWCTAYGEYTGSQRRFSQKLEAVDGIEAKRKNRERGFRGVTIYGPEETNSYGKKVRSRLWSRPIKNFFAP